MCFISYILLVTLKQDDSMSGLSIIGNLEHEYEYKAFKDLSLSDFFYFLFEINTLS